MLRFKSEKDYEAWCRKYGIHVDDVPMVVSTYGPEADIRVRRAQRAHVGWSVEWLVLGLVVGTCALVWLVW